MPRVLVELGKQKLQMPQSSRSNRHKWKINEVQKQNDDLATQPKKLQLFSLTQQKKRELGFFYSFR